MRGPDPKRLRTTTPPTRKRSPGTARIHPQPRVASKRGEVVNFDCYREAPDDRDWWDVVEVADAIGITTDELIAFLLLEHWSASRQAKAPAKGEPDGK